MAKQKKTPETAEDEKARKAAQRRARADTVAQVAHAIRHRDEIVTSALGMLAGAGVLDQATEARLLKLYTDGDARTRSVIQQVVARVLRVPADQIEHVIESGEVDPAALSGQALEALDALTLPELDISAAAERVRSLDMEGWVDQRSVHTKMAAVLGDLPLAINRARLRMLQVGIAALLVVAAALLFPDQALWIAFFGLLGLIAILGGLLLSWSWKINRAAKRADLDLAVLARLTPEERRLILMRRLLLRFADANRLGDFVERGLGAMVPQGMQATNATGRTRGATVAPARAPKGTSSAPASAPAAAPAAGREEAPASRAPAPARPIASTPDQTGAGAPPTDKLPATKPATRKPTVADATGTAGTAAKTPARKVAKRVPTADAKTAPSPRRKARKAAPPKRPTKAGSVPDEE